MPTSKTTTKKSTTQVGKSATKKVNNSVKLDTVNPIPFEYGGTTFQYISGLKYIPFLSTGDGFFQTLLEAKLLSTTHASCIETKSDYCAGNGLYDIQEKEFSTEFTKWLQSINAKNQSANTVNRNIFGSHFTFGNTPVEIVRVTVGNRKFVYVYAHNVLEWRLASPDSDGIVRKAIHSKLFLRQGIVNVDLLKTAREIPIYNPSRPDSAKNWLKDGAGVERTVIWLKNEMSGYENYGMPQSISSLIYQVLEYKAARFNLDNFENNMVLGGILTLQGNLTQGEADKIGRTVINSHTGDGKRGRVAVLSSEQGIDESKFEKYDTQKEGSFVESDDKVMAKIIMANQWHAMLAGLDHSSTLGKGNTFLRQVYEQKKTTVIDPMQKFLIDNLWKPVQGILKSWVGIDADQYDLGIRDIDPVSALGEVDVTPAVTLDELRAAFGLPADTTGQGGKYIGELFKVAKPTKPTE